MRRLAYLGALVFTIGAGALFAASRGAFEFPHEKHAALASDGCETCHAGIYSGDAALRTVLRWAARECTRTTAISSST